MKTGRPKELDVVKLTRDLPEFGIRAGHVGTIVFVHPAEAVMVEFLAPGLEAPIADAVVRPG
jgi:hypothetical protein